MSFIVALTPIIIGFFTWLGLKGREPSTPRKIGIGMIITAMGFVVLVIGSLRLIGYSPKEIGEIRIPDENLPLWGHWLVLVTCWLISAVFIFSVIKRLEWATK